MRLRPAPRVGSGLPGPKTEVSLRPSVYVKGFPSFYRLLDPSRDPASGVRLSGATLRPPFETTESRTGTGHLPTHTRPSPHLRELPSLDNGWCKRETTDSFMRRPSLVSRFRRHNKCLSELLRASSRLWRTYNFTFTVN